MSSREIAELTGKRHDHVMADVEKMLIDLGEDAPKFRGMYLDAYKREKPCYNLPKRETMILVSGYSIQLRARIIDRWQELEAKQAPAIPTSFVEALRLAADLAEQKAQTEAKLIVSEQKVAELAPVAAVTETLFNRGRMKKARDVGRMLPGVLNFEETH